MTLRLFTLSPLTGFRVARLATRSLLAFAMLVFASLCLWPADAGERPAQDAASPRIIDVAAREGRRNVMFNLSHAWDWSTQQPFIDMMRLARPWIGHLRGRWGGVGEADLVSGGYLDDDGWVLAVPGHVVKLSALILTDMPAEATSLAGRYHVRWEGSAYLGFSGRARNVRYSGRNSATFDYTPGPGFVSLEFNRGDLRNLSVVHERHLDRFERGEVFNPDWLARVGDAQGLRFMNWMGTNDSTVSSWQERPRPERYTWAGGVPLEVMIALANETGAEPWFTLPHLADDDYMRRFAQMVQADLRPDLRAWLEFSNEVWNFQFAQARWARDQGRERWESDNAWVQYYALRASEMVGIFNEVFADDPERLVRVIAVQTGWLGLEQGILDPPLLRAEAPQAPAPFTLFDAYAVTGYFRSVLQREENDALMQEWLAESRAQAEAEAEAQGLEGAARADFIAAHRFDEAIARAGRDMRDGAVSGQSYRSLQDLFDRVLLHHAAIAEAHDLALVMYEGGTHALARADQHEDEDIVAFYEALNYSAAMGDLYREFLDRWSRLSAAPANLYSDVIMPSRWGYWGHLRHLDDDNPRWDAVMEATAP